MSQGHFGAPVVTLTPAPTLDRTYFVNNLHPGQVNRADDVREELAGKGINVSRGLTLANIHAPGVVPIGNADINVLERTGSSFLVPMWVEGSLRVSTTIVDKHGTTTKVNESPRSLSEEDWQKVIDLTEQEVRNTGAKWLVIAGALPTYKSTGVYVDLQPIFDSMKAMGVKVALDTSGEPLSYWARKGCANVIKPNAEELASAVGRELATVGDVVDALQVALGRHGDPHNLRRRLHAKLRRDLHRQVVDKRSQVAWRKRQHRRQCGWLRQLLHRYEMPLQQPRGHRVDVHLNVGVGHVDPQHLRVR